MAGADLGIALRNASMEGLADTVETLLAQGADANSRTQTGNLNTPLHCAAARGHDKVVEKLIGAGAKPESRNSEGESALHLAIRHDFPQIAAYLLDEGGSTLEEYDKRGDSPLHKAAYLGKVASIEVLLKRGADRTEENEDGKTPLDLAKSEEALTLLEHFQAPMTMGTFTVKLG